jgi:hypothetical protein
MVAVYAKNGKGFKKEEALSFSQIRLPIQIPCKILAVHKCFAGKECFLALAEVRVVHAAINGANCRALWLIVETNTLCTLIGYYIVHIHSPWGLGRISIYRWVANGANLAFKGGSIRKTPLYSSFVNCIIRAFGLASSAVNALICYHYSHTKYF